MNFIKEGPSLVFFLKILGPTYKTDLPLDTPEHVRDPHVVVVDDVGQVVRGEAVRLQDDGVALDGVHVVRSLTTHHSVAV